MLQRDNLLMKDVIPLDSGNALAANKVLRNTYLLLSLTLLFSAGTAGIAMATHAPPLHWLVTLGGYFGLLFVVTRVNIDR